MARALAATQARENRALRRCAQADTLQEKKRLALEQKRLSALEFRARRRHNLAHSRSMGLPLPQ